MSTIYLDNAATSPLDPNVLEEMLPYMKEYFGNPSSIHSYGRKTKAAIEKCRKIIADCVNCSPGEIVFTSGGTEADNMAIHCAVQDLGITHIITSAIEHHAVLHTVEHLNVKGKVKLSLVNINQDGEVDLDHLETLLSENEKSLVSLMHANNEIGTLLPLKEVGGICKKYDALFHSDTVQTMGHYRFDLQEVNIHFITCAAHKFHGPKGTGFLYIHPDVVVKPKIFGGAQERNMRGGTENLYGIVGLGRAMEIAHEEMEQHQVHIQGIKSYMIELLQKNIDSVSFNGTIVEDKSLYTVLNVCFPKSEKAEMLLYMLDIEGIAVSGGSACSSGSDQGSHVLKVVNPNPERTSVRFSFSKYTTKKEIDVTIEKLMSLLS